MQMLEYICCEHDCASVGDVASTNSGLKKIRNIVLKEAPDVSNIWGKIETNQINIYFRTYVALWG